MTKKQIFFMSPEALIGLYKKGGKPDYHSLGVRLSSNIALAGVLYQKREHTPNAHAQHLFVDKDSFKKERGVILDYLLEEVVLAEYQRGLASSTIFKHLKNSIHFIDWADSNGVDFNSDRDAARAAYEQYTMHLKNSIRAGVFKNPVAGVRQAQAIKMLRAIFSDKQGYISSGIPLIPYKDVSANSTGLEKSDDMDRRYAFRFYNDLFNQIADFLLSQNKYPFVLNLSGKKCWLLPFESRFPWVVGEHNPNIVRAFDFEMGDLMDSEKMQSLYGVSRKNVNGAKSQLRTRMRKHNKAMDTSARLYLGTMGMKAYYMLFLALTGMNDSTAATLPWSDEYEVGKEQQKFRNIKYRAGNKLVEFQLQSRFIGAFKKFLQLRSFVLNGHSSEYLFFNHYGKSSSLTVEQSSGKYSSSINRYMKKWVDPDLPVINSRQSRVNKTHWAIENHGVAAASQLAQSSMAVIVKAYTGESESSSAKQLTDYFHKLNKAIIVKDGAGTELGIGQCMHPDDPKANIALPGVTVKCNQSYGCLFCEQFRVHADESDAHKLYSALYVIDESRYIAKDEEHFRSVLGPVAERIESVLDKLSTCDGGMAALLQKVKKNVYEDEILHPYWEHKLATLARMGVLR